MTHAPNVEEMQKLAPFVPELARSGQWLTLVHFSAQHKRYLWHGGCVEGSFRARLEVLRE